MTFSQIFEAVLQILLIIIGGLLIPFIKMKWGEEKYQNVLRAVEIAVSAAEQIYKSLPKSEFKNEKRLKYAMDYLINVKGIKLCQAELEVLIEDAVLRISGVIAEKESPV